MELIKNNVKLSSENLKYVFKQFINFILLLKEYGYVHNDLKVDNAMLCDKEE